MEEITEEVYRKLKSQKLKRSEIAEVLGVPEWKLKRIISQKGWGAKVLRYKYNNCFSSLNKESAYWLGFLYADGCVDKKNRVRLYLKKSDIDHIEKFKLFTNSIDFKTQISDKFNRVAIEFTSKSMCEDLAKYNITPLKTLTQIPPEIPEEFMGDFLRGLFDGDGTICESFSNKNSITATLYTGFCISKLGLPWLDNVLTNIVGVTYKIFEKENVFTITLNTNKSKKLLLYMYNNSEESTRLDRKYELFVKTVINDNRLIR